MLGPPVEAREAEVEIAERADHRDGADRGLALERVRRGGRVVELHLGHDRPPQFLSPGRPPLHAEATCGISVSFRRTLRATSISCCQVVKSIGTPFCSRSSLRARSGSPGASTSTTPGCGLADFTQVMKVSTSSSNSSVPPIAAGSMTIDSILLMMSVPSFLMVL